jgi:CRISPR-associated exonuclease Cas4
VLAYPKERKRESVTLDESATEKVESTVAGILTAVKQDQPAELEKKPYCDSCLYQDICWM